MNTTRITSGRIKKKARKMCLQSCRFTGVYQRFKGVYPIKVAASKSYTQRSSL